PGQPRLIDHSWSSGPLATKTLHSNGFLFGSGMGVTAQRGGYTPPYDEPMNYPLVLAALDFNNGCSNSGTAPGAFDQISGFRSVHSGGCNFLFCDGGVRFVRETIVPETYRALVHHGGRRERDRPVRVGGEALKAPVEHRGLRRGKRTAPEL